MVSTFSVPKVYDLDPRGFYSITKESCRTKSDYLLFCQVYEVKYRILRIANVYGGDKTVSSKECSWFPG